MAREDNNLSRSQNGLRVVWKDCLTGEKKTPGDKAGEDNETGKTHRFAMESLVEYR